MALYLRCTIVLTISQVELNLFTERHDALSGAARRAEAEARAEKARADLTLTLTTLTLTTLRLTTSSYRLTYTSPSPDH